MIGDGKWKATDTGAEEAHPRGWTESTGLSGVVEYRGKAGAGVPWDGANESHCN